MYLQSLELQGFKSFPDKIKLTFDKGLTGVVGPNGSGKSNIGDAVCWVLGEQSTKTLRGNKMEDVIFSGTKSRKSMGFATVTLEINNETGELGDDYGAVVSVTRKLYRSGDSEYRINGKQVRLKDVTELFMDTGMGRDGYAIIGQGRIAEIVSAKSTDRRDIFEEAAGVSKFRHKKEDAQRKLDAAQENLNRLTDIVSELESRIEPLRKQSEKAKQYVEMAQSQKELEISLWVRRLSALRTKIQEMSDDYLKIQAQFDNAGLEIQQTEQQIEKGYQKMQESTLKIESFRQEIAAAEEQAAQLQAALAVCENEIHHGEDTICSLEQQMESTKQEAEEMTSKLDGLSVQMVQLRQKRESLSLEQERLEQDAKELEQRTSVQGSQSEQANTALQALYVRQSELRVMWQTAAGQQEELRVRVTEQAARQNALQQEYNSALLAVQEAKDKAQEAKEKFAQVQNQQKGLQMRYQNAIQLLEQGKRSRDSATFALREKRQRQKLLQDMERNMEGFTGSVKAVLRADGGHPHGVYGTVAQRITTQQKYGVAIETALGGAMQNLIVTDENAAKQWIRFLAKNHAGRATFLPLTSVRGREWKESGLESYDGFVGVAANLVEYESQFREIVQFLLGRIVVAEDLDVATELAKAYRYRFRIVTLDGQVINAGGSFTGGSAQRSGGVMTRKAELNTLSGEVKKLEEDLKREEAAFQKVQQQSVQLEGQLETLQRQCRVAESESVNANAQMEKCGYVRQQAESHLQQAQMNRDQFLQRQQESAEKVASAKEALSQVEADMQAAQSALRQETIQLDELQKQQAKLSDRRTQLQLKVIAVEKDMEILTREIGQQGNMQKSLQERLTEIERDSMLQKQRITEKQAELEQTKQQLEQLKSAQSGSRKQIQQWQQIHDEQDSNVRQLQSGLTEWNTAKERFSGEMEWIDERKSNAQRDYDGVVRQLFEQYELSLSEAQNFAKPLDDLQDAQRQLQSIKGRIRALGSVNVASIQEYQEVSERYRFLSEQMGDAQTAKRELEDLIVSLTTEMQRIFSESFTEINQNFKEIFVDLFGGGDARLELTYPDDVLESGIEIKVAPPGKVIKNLISLSGGEQSFVAIAIYFAILRLHPSPFCILDEIDAALDEGNVRKYAQYLRNFTDTTQFILVTHRRSAMEEASVLYGVTMQEDGVSKLLRMEQEEFSELES